jgi:hypothetical protein
MDENYIIWKNLGGADAVAILTDFANEYRDTDTVQGLRLYKIPREDAYLILFKEDPDFDIFSFLINYINYPKGYERYGAFIRGYYKTKLILTGREKISGNRVMVYISKHDTQYDNVFFIDEAGRHFINDFGRGIKRAEGQGEPYEFIPYDLKDFELNATIAPQPKGYRHTANTRKKPWWKIW